MWKLGSIVFWVAVATVFAEDIVVADVVVVAAFVVVAADAVVAVVVVVVVFVIIDFRLKASNAVTAVFFLPKISFN